MENNLIPSSYQIEKDKASLYSIQSIEIKDNISSLNLIMHSDTESNVCLITSTKYLHNWVNYKGLVNETGGGKATVIAYGDLHALFEINDTRYRIIIHCCYVMPSNNHHTLGLAPFKKAGCSKAIHNMHEKVEFHLENGEINILPVTVVSNLLDYVTLKIILPADIN